MGRTPAQQSSDLQVLTSKTNALTNVAKNITIVNGPLLVIGQGPYLTVITGLTDIVTTATSQIAGTQGSGTIAAEKDANQLMADFTVLVLCQQQLLNVLIGKAGLFSTVPFICQPVAAALRSVESVLDTLAFGLVGQCESLTTVAAQLTNQQASLDQTLSSAIHAHEIATM